MKVCFFTLGCKVNQYETQCLKELFSKNGWTVVNEKEGCADAYVFNSCTVTATSHLKLKKLIKKIKRQNPNSIVAIVGCFAQAFPEECCEIAEANVIAGNFNKNEIFNLLTKYIETKEKVVEIKPFEKNSNSEDLTIKKFINRTRAIVKIEDGCFRCCSYCIIPKARGFQIKSKPLEILKKEVEDLAENGYTEIVLVGINLSSYGFELKNVRLVDAVKTISEIEKIKRIRLGSLEPDLLKREDIEKLEQIEKFCPQFHIALQSGCDSILEKMNRHYSKKYYEDLVNHIFKVFKNPSITTDVIVGFPQESEEEFGESLKFVEKTKFLKVHIFPYSKRERTKAAEMDGQLTKIQKQKRVKQMEQAAKVARENFLKTQMDVIQNVLFETKDGEFYEGYSENYIKIKAKCEFNLCGRIKPVKITKIDKTFCVGKIL